MDMKNIHHQQSKNMRSGFLTSDLKSRIACSMNPIDDCFLSRAEVMRRWRVSIRTLKRREQQGILRPIRMSAHAVRYRLSDVVRGEDEAAAGRKWQETEEDRNDRKIA